jgi:Flp pilus assembly protein TadG
MKRAKAGSLATADGGTTAIEFALVAPIFLMFLFGVVEFGRLLWTQQALQQAAIAGVRCMAIAQGSAQSSSCATGGTCSPCAPSGSYSESSTQTYIQTVASGWGLSIPLSQIFPTQNAPATACGTAGLSEVEITSTFVTPVPQLVRLAAGGTTVTAIACYPPSP